MTLFRRYSVFVAALLLAVVAVQMLDMGLCCAWDRATSSPVEAASEVILLDVTGVSTDLLVSRGEKHEHGYPMQPDCLCHLIFVTSGMAADLQAIVIPISAVPEVQESPYSTLLSPPGHIPIA